MERPGTGFSSKRHLKLVGVSAHGEAVVGAGEELRAESEKQPYHTYSPGRLRLYASRQHLKMAGPAAVGVYQARPSICGCKRTKGTASKSTCLKFKSCEFTRT